MFSQKEVTPFVALKVVVIVNLTFILLMFIERII